MPSCSEDNRPNADNHDCPAKREGKHPLEYAIFVFVVLTAFATGAAAWYTRQQWLVYRDTEKTPTASVCRDCRFRSRACAIQWRNVRHLGDLGKLRLYSDRQSCNDDASTDIGCGTYLPRLRRLHHTSNTDSSGSPPTSRKRPFRSSR